MFKLFLLLLSLFVMSGCVSTELSPKGNKKVFEEEDRYILFALRAEQLKQYNISSDIFNTLYKKAHKKEYLYRSLQNDLTLKRDEKVVQRIDKIGIDNLDDFILVRIKIIALVQLQKLEDAKKLALKLVKKSNSVDDYLLVSDIYVKQKKFDTAVKYLESAYSVNYNEKILDKMAIILYVNLQRKKDAIAYLETHSRVYSCSKLICSRLIGFYSNDNNIDGLLSAYLRLYKIDTRDAISKKIIQIYEYKKDYLKLVMFLEESKSDNALLLNLYQNSSNYKKAAPLADKLYAKTGEINYLGKSAIFKYESFKNKDDKVMQRSVIEKLKKVVKVNSSPLYLNYLGYILIDHSINVAEGMKYIKMALDIEPNSAFYLDSLAWGYFKLGKCKKAYKIMQRVVKLEGFKNHEVQLHVKAIQKCLKRKKVKKKK
jgi:predicted Zn-dependent protease